MTPAADSIEREHWSPAEALDILNSSFMRGAAQPCGQWDWLLWALARVQQYALDNNPFLEESWGARPERLFSICMRVLVRMAPDNGTTDPLGHARLSSLVRQEVDREHFTIRNRQVHWRIWWKGVWRVVDRTQQVSGRLTLKQLSTVYLLSRGLSAHKIASDLRIQRNSVQKRADNALVAIAQVVGVDNMPSK